LADLQRTVYPHKWSPVSRRSSAGQRKFACQRPTFYHCATQPTNIMMWAVMSAARKWLIWSLNSGLSLRPKLSGLVSAIEWSKKWNDPLHCIETTRGLNSTSSTCAAYAALDHVRRQSKIQNTKSCRYATLQESKWYWRQLSCAGLVTSHAYELNDTSIPQNNLLQRAWAWNSIQGWTAEIMDSETLSIGNNTRLCRVRFCIPYNATLYC